jgi:hypothetical protein
LLELLQPRQLQQPTGPASAFHVVGWQDAADLRKEPS